MHGLITNTGKGLFVCLFLQNKFKQADSFAFNISLLV